VEPSILIIEDDLLIVKMLGLQLGQAGYRVLTAVNGFQGLKMARTDAPDLILLDLMLPGMDGFEVLNQLRSDPSTAKLPVVIVSAKAGQADMEMASRIGADGYLVKPVRLADLLSILRSLLTEKQEEPAAHGLGVAVAGARGGEAGLIATSLGVALALRGKATTLVDLHPFSSEHSMLLGMLPRPSPVLAVASGGEVALNEVAREHPSGLRVLDNLEGGDAAGQLAPADAQSVLGVLLAQDSIVLADVPVYPAGVLLKAASQCARILLVAHSNPVALGAGRAALTMMQRVGIDMGQVGLVLVGAGSEEAGGELGYPVIARVSEGSGPETQAFQALAEWVLNLT
jgi:DNA-binding response OmpR family regulator